MAHIVIRFKRLFQELCHAKKDQNQPLADKLLKKWASLVGDLWLSKPMSVPRYYLQKAEQSVNSYRLKGFVMHPQVYMQQLLTCWQSLMCMQEHTWFVTAKTRVGTAQADHFVFRAAFCLVACQVDRVCVQNTEVLDKSWTSCMLPWFRGSTLLDCRKKTKCGYRLCKTELLRSGSSWQLDNGSTVPERVTQQIFLQEGCLHLSCVGMTCGSMIQSSCYIRNQMRRSHHRCLKSAYLKWLWKKSKQCVDFSHGTLSSHEYRGV